jgi:predicted dehydrogenase
MKDRVEIACGCDINAGALQNKAEKYGFRKYSAYEEMLSKENPDFVLLCTPQMERKRPIELCVKKGIPVFTEKPPAADLKTARDIETVIRKDSTPVSVGFVFRYMPIVKKAAALLEGRSILLLDMQYLCPMMYPDRRGRSFFYRKELSGGLVMDQAIHLLDLVRFVLKDEITEVHAFGANLMQGKTKEISTEESVSMNLRSYKGSIVSYLHTWISRTWETSIEIFAPSARIKLDFTANRLSGTVDDVDVSYSPKTNGSIYYEELDEFIKSISGEGGEILSPYADSVKTMKLADAVMKAVDSGCVITIDRGDE